MQNLLIACSGKAQSGKTTVSNILKQIINEQQYKKLCADPKNAFVEKEYLKTLNGEGEVYEFRVFHTPLETMEYPGTHDVKVNAEIISFANALRDIARTYFGWSGDKGIYYVEKKKREFGSLILNDKGSFFTPEEKTPIPDKGRQLLINIGKAFREIRKSIWCDIALNKIKELFKQYPQDQVFLIDDCRFQDELIAIKEFPAAITIRITRPGQSLINDPTEKDLDDAEFDYYIENDGDIADLTEKIACLYKLIELKYSHTGEIFNAEQDSLGKTE